MTDKRYYTELITLYFDGEITREEEQILFKALADEPLLQAEFHRARRIDSLLKISPANVPLELDNAVLNRVGIRNRERRGLAILWNTVTPAQALRYAAAIGFFISSGMLVWYSSLHNRPENSTASVSEIKTPMLHKFDDANRKNPVSQYHAIPTPEKDKQLEGITLYSDHRHVGGQSVFANHLPTGKSQTIEHKRNQLDNTLLTRSEGVPENIEQVTELAQQPASFVLPEAVINPSITALRES
ncbi:MAG: hypothetical protein JNL32_04605, partial [Candidatus Kapabacteria bacterium]|nr:hypothetical protein [Candidatus Kapabacteria bacterium]